MSTSSFDDFAFSDIFTAEDFARWRAEAMAKAEEDERRERMRDWWR